jgi:hypothetical protein
MSILSSGHLVDRMTGSYLVILMHTLQAMLSLIDTRVAPWFLPDFNGVTWLL